MGVLKVVEKDEGKRQYITLALFGCHCNRITGLFGVRQQMLEALRRSDCKLVFLFFHLLISMTCLMLGPSFHIFLSWANGLI